jgi:hypothetical protein
MVTAGTEAEQRKAGLVRRLSRSAWRRPCRCPVDAKEFTKPLRPRSLILNGMEHFFACPYCWQRISFVLDTSITGQTYVEDCEVCCRPIEVLYTVEEGEISEFEAKALE